MESSIISTVPRQNFYPWNKSLPNKVLTSIFLFLFQCMQKRYQTMHFTNNGFQKQIKRILHVRIKSGDIPIFLFSHRLSYFFQSARYPFGRLPDFAIDAKISPDERAKGTHTHSLWSSMLWFTRKCTPKGGFAFVLKKRQESF